MASSRHPLPIPEAGERLKAQFGDDVSDVLDEHGHAVVTVGRERYRELVAMVRDDPAFACDYFDFLSAVDFPEADAIDLVTHFSSTTTRTQVRIKVRLSRDAPTVPTISDLYAGANWQERETWELFGIVFEGHPHLVKLVLPEPFEGHPLRKDFVLMSREAKVWPGDLEVEEGEEE